MASLQRYYPRDVHNNLVHFRFVGMGSINTEVSEQVEFVTQNTELPP